MNLEEMAELEAAGCMSPDLAKMRDALIDAAKAFTITTKEDGGWYIEVNKLHMSIVSEGDVHADWRLDDLVRIFRGALHVALQQRGLM